MTQTVLFFMWLIPNRDQMEISCLMESHIEFHSHKQPGNLLSGKHHKFDAKQIDDLNITYKITNRLLD